MNTVHMIGNLSKAPEIRTTTSGISVCTFTLAVNRRRTKDGEKVTDFFTCIAWRGLADLCAKYLAKGNKAAITGELQTRSYEKDGVKRYVTEIVCDDVEFLTPKERREDQQDEQGAPEGFTPMDDSSDLPF